MPQLLRLDKLAEKCKDMTELESRHNTTQMHKKVKKIAGTYLQETIDSDALQRIKPAYS